MTKKVLVTGGTGFLANHLIAQLLQQGYDVKTTVRNLAKQDQIKTTLKQSHVENLSNLSFIAADLMSDDNWDEAMADRDYVFSVASPVFFERPKSEVDAIKPAVEGITRIIHAAQRNQIKRIVMTSNFGAVGFSRLSDDLKATTEIDWTKEDQVGLSIYEKSKLIAEKTAWKLINRPDNQVEFVTVNPVAIFGPLMSGHASGSFDVITNILNGKMRLIPNIELNIVDVRDVADIEILAMFSDQANGQRFIASANGKISMPEIAKLIRSKRPQFAKKISRLIFPDWLLKLASYVNSDAKEGRLLLKMNRNVSNHKAKEYLNWHPLNTNEEIILTSVDSLVHFGLITE